MKPFVTGLLIWFFAGWPLCSAQKFQVDTLQKTGPINRRINVVILGDGFTQSELPKFDQEAKKFMNFFLNYEPYTAYANYFNFFSIRTPSKESGATNPGTAPDRYPDQPTETKDTYFGSSFGNANIHRLVVIQKYEAFTNVMATNFPAYDMAIMIVNSPWYGGSGGPWPATFTLHASSNLIGVHEIGHSFSALADEYWVGASYARETANMTHTNNPGSVTWKNWLNQFNIGIFPHSGDADAVNWYKPTTHNCLMEQLNSPFCAVCREATTNRIVQLIKPVEKVQPLAESSVLVKAQPETFQLTLLKPSPNTLQIEWRLNDVVINRASDQVTISNNQLTRSTNTLSVSVFDSTSFIRSENHRQQHTYTYQWTLEKAAPSQLLALTASKSSLCSGESATLTAANCTGTVTWSTGAMSSSISVSPSQSTTYSASCLVAGVSSQTALVGITVLPLPVVQVSNTGPYNEGQPIQLAAQGGTSYAWTGPDNFTSAEQNPVISPGKASQAGTYTVTVTSADGCVSNAQTTVTVSPLLAVGHVSGDAVWVSPNPAKGRVQIQTTLVGELEVTLFDAAGHEVLKQSFYKSTNLFIDKLPKAIYLYHVRNQEKVMTGKLLVD